MLRLLTGHRSHNCDRITRRALLQIGTLGLAGLSLPDLWTVRAQAAGAGQGVKNTSVVFLFLTGGPSQIETFDPKMTAPAEYRSVSGEVATSLPGVTFGGTFPRTARWAHKMAVIRSFSHGISDHTKAVEHVIQGGNPAEAGMGALLSRMRGTSHPTTGIPTHIHLNASEIDPQFHKEQQRLLTAEGPGHLGASHVPFQPGGHGQANQNLTLTISRRQLEDRRALQKVFDQVARQVDALGMMAALGHFEQQAFDLILGRARAAFDLSAEDPRVVERYDTSRFQTGIKKYRPSELGKQLLLARRLCEAGCGFVTIHNPGWDMHGGDTQLNMPRGMEELGRPVDHAVSAFIEDVEQRGLSDQILLVITGEFGRTPKVNKSGGRDHWPQLSPLALAGGGLKMGQTIGRSSAHAETPVSTPITPENLLATVLHVLFDIPTLRLVRGLPRSIATTIERAQPIAELV
ncbi:MAG: DUF1501 domain-containing protein [Gemmataceae bacterium]|nr:DUF1501 domain-containing protein [Gemmataceae bacterium]